MEQWREFSLERYYESQRAKERGKERELFGRVRRGPDTEKRRRKVAM